MAINDDPSVAEAAANLQASPIEEILEKKTETAVKPFKSYIVWKNLIGFAILHLACLYGFVLILLGQVMVATLAWSEYLHELLLSFPGHLSHVKSPSLFLRDHNKNVSISRRSYTSASSFLQSISWYISRLFPL